MVPPVRRKTPIRRVKIEVRRTAREIGPRRVPRSLISCRAKHGHAPEAQSLPTSYSIREDSRLSFNVPARPYCLGGPAWGKNERALDELFELLPPTHRGCNTCSIVARQRGGAARAWRAQPRVKGFPCMSDLFILLTQLVVILLAARILGLLFRRIHQPQVVGEMTAGILLGPSLLGWVAPGGFATLFPPASLGLLGTLSQVGLLLFMFLVGVELNPKLLRGKGRSALAISWTSILFPFGLGVLLAVYLYARLSDPSVSQLAFTLFLGAGMSVTAFPVLARILAERDMLGTRVGALAITCASVDDVSAWTILAAVLLIVNASGGGAAVPFWLTLGGTVALVALMWAVVRPLLRHIEPDVQRSGLLSQDRLLLILLVTLVSGAITEGLGLHALFGAFLAGVILPKGERFVHVLTEKLQDLTVVLLLPLYFAFTGLRTSLGLLGSGDPWAVCGLIILVAVVGKWLGALCAARMTGQGWRDASAIGILMNTRGMVELVLLNVGLDRGILSPTLFSMLVLMALVTTCMTTPLLDLAYPLRLRQAERAVRPCDAVGT